MNPIPVRESVVQEKIQLGREWQAGNEMETEVEEVVEEEDDNTWLCPPSPRPPLAATRRNSPSQ